MELLKKANGNIPRTEEEKLKMIEEAAVHYGRFMDVVIPGWRQESGSIDTPKRVAKSFINDLVKSIHGEFPKITHFDNEMKYDGIVAQCNIPVRTICMHHHLPVFGSCHVGYVVPPDGKIIGLSKLNKIVSYWSHMPQTQESMCMQVHDTLNEILEGNRGIAVVIHATHLCTCHRGVYHDSEMHTAKMSGLFFDNEIGTRAEFYKMVENSLRLKR